MAAAMEVRRRGPWTEQEDLQLIAGLRRTGKSCRLRWLNYLHPDLRHGRLTPDEELLVLHLHAQWGNRWSRIARCLPGRTDNEIKNYWRTHMRKKTQERTMINSSSSSTSSSSSFSSISGWVEGYSMDQIWDDIAAAAATAASDPLMAASESLWKVDNEEYKISTDLDMITNLIH